MQPFYIGPFDQGAEKGMEPFYIPEKAFPTLTNAFIFRGRVKKKSGYVQLGRLRRCLTAQALTNTVASDTYDNGAADILITLGLRANEPDAEIQAGEFIITIDSGGASETILNDATTSGTLSTTATNALNATGGTINYVTGIISITFAAPIAAGLSVEIDFCYYLMLPVMGLCTYEQGSLNFENLISFDTIYAYKFNQTSGKFEELLAGTTWSGTDSDLFWCTNFWPEASSAPLLWVTNFSGTGGDPTRYWDGSAWTNFAPTINGIAEIHQSRILLPYKGRLVALNTYEGGTLATSQNYPRRARWSELGDPTDTANGWRDDITGHGGFVDCPTNEQIIAAASVKDQLIVYFEKSTWQLVYTGNEVLPFVWKSINSELGAESTFSGVTFDNGLVAMGQSGLHTTNGFNVERIDEEIPNTVYTINNDDDGPKRVYGIRDFYNELAYWTYPEQTNTTSGVIYPNKVLVYNYRSNTFSSFNESFTCYGNFQRNASVIWATLPYDTWEEWDAPWNSGILQSRFPDIVAGNQQGFVLQLVPGITANDESRAIKAINTATNTLTSPNHNLFVGDFVYITGVLGTTGINDTVYKIVTTPTVDTFTIAGTFASDYIGGGEIKVLSNINIKTRMFNFFWKEGKSLRSVQVDFLMERTSGGEFSVNFFVDQTNTFSLSDTSLTSILGQAGAQNHVLTAPEEAGLTNQAAQIWHRLYTYGSGQEYQLQFFLDDDQMMDLQIAESTWELHGMILYFSEGGDLL